MVGEQKVEVGANAIVEVTVPIEPMPEEPGSSAGRSRLVPVLLWASGGAALVGSAVAFYYGQKGWPEDNYSYRGATETGFGLAGAGLVAVGMASWLWLREPSESLPVAAVAHGGAYLGWGGRF